MKVNLAKSAGFCFGVQRALNIALRQVKSKNNIFMLGDIVHNENVVRLIKKTGIKKISHLTSGRGKTLLIRAHGASFATFKKAKSLGYNIIDATCPMVKEIHKIAQDAENEGFDIIVIGDKKHDEVQGIVGQLKKKAVIIDDKNKIPVSAVKKIKRAAVVVQSTQNIEKVLKILGKLRNYIPELKFYNTICRPTRIKQEEIKCLPLKNDAMVIIGSKKSANTKRLYEISKSLNKRTFWVNSSKELKRGYFKDLKSVGVTTGASTPKESIRKITEYLSGL
ncbi:MAG: 4-hydroxy-3-methylbut-2-enyl diphosphate reductase [Candidatus Omnitrophota bacterium]|jgi:4-hydroxy-3-methylbut-2-enyl diphosphate reductase